jgi:hypothetical protein
MIPPRVPLRSRQGFVAEPARATCVAAFLLTFALSGTLLPAGDTRA